MITKENIEAETDTETSEVKWNYVRVKNTEKIQENIIQPWIENFPFVHKNGYILPPGKYKNHGDKLMNKNPVFDGEKVWSPENSPLKDVEDEPLFKDLKNHLGDEDDLIEKWNRFKDLSNKIYENYVKIISTIRKDITNSKYS